LGKEEKEPLRYGVGGWDLALAPEREGYDGTRHTSAGRRRDGCAMLPEASNCGGSSSRLMVGRLIAGNAYLGGYVAGLAATGDAYEGECLIPYYTRPS